MSFEQFYSKLIMKKVYLILLQVIVNACSSDRIQMQKDIEVIPVEVQNTVGDASTFLEKIEIIPLETIDSSLIHKSRKIIYDEEMNIYAIYTREQIVYTFTGDGKFIDNSSRMKGQGPKEYYMILDVNFNTYLKGIDMLNPYGTIYTYSPNFELLSKRKVEMKYPVDHFIGLNSDEYVFTYPYLWTEPEISFVNMKTKQIHYANYGGVIAGGNTMDHECFHRVDSNFFFVPTGVNYYCYKVDVENYELIPYLYLDFGKEEIDEKGLPGCGWGRKSETDKERQEVVKDFEDRYRFLRNSNHIIPSIKFFNDDYVYIFMVKTTRGLGSSYIYNRKTKKGSLMKGGSPFFMCPCFTISGNVLQAICPPDKVADAVDKKLMSFDEIHKMDELKEDDNPVIIKYYLKK